MVANSDLIKGANDLAEEILGKSALWRMKFARPLFGRARLYLTTLAHRLHETETDVIRLRREVKLFPTTLRRAVEDAEKVSHRIELAIYELEANKNNRKTETPFAIILSPYQLNKVRLTARLFVGKGWAKDDSIVKFAGIPVYTAKGVYGPLVLTEAAFNAFSRNAPELLIKGA